MIRQHDGGNPSLFGDPDNTIPFATAARAIADSAARTGCEHLGLLVGQRNGAANLGLVGFLMLNAADVGSGLRSLIRHLHLHDRGGVPTFSLQQGSVLLGYAVYERGILGSDQVADLAIATGFNMMRRLCGPDWRPVEILLAHRRPDDIRPFRRFFGAPVRFDADQNALAFSADWLNQPIPGADPELRRLLQKQVDELETRDFGDFPHQVRRVLRTAVLAHRAGADQVASLFSMHSRTLNRRLQAFGTSFQKLADEARYEIARQMLGKSEIALSEIAAALDYADASAFTRAFRRWSGTTPAEWRTRQRVGPDGAFSRSAASGPG